MAKIYYYDKIVEMHGIMKQIDENRAQLEKHYLESGRLTPELFDVEKRIDDLVVEYMRLARVSTSV